jgi:hypothetical protein
LDVNPAWSPRLNLRRNFESASVIDLSSRAVFNLHVLNLLLSFSIFSMTSFLCSILFNKNYASTLRLIWRLKLIIWVFFINQDPFHSFPKLMNRLRSIATIETELYIHLIISNWMFWKAVKWWWDKKMMLRFKVVWCTLKKMRKQCGVSFHFVSASFPLAVWENFYTLGLVVGHFDLFHTFRIRIPILFSLSYALDRCR